MSSEVLAAKTVDSILGRAHSRVFNGHAYMEGMKDI